MSQERAGQTIRAFSPGDERPLRALFERVFGRTVTEQHWRWKFKRPVAPIENVWVGVIDGEIASQCAAMPVRYHLPRGEAMVMTEVDRMTAPEFRRRGLFTAVAHRAFASWRDGGAALVIGLPNQHTKRQLAALGYEEALPLQWLVRPLRPERILARRLGWRRLSSIRFTTRAWDSLWPLGSRPDPHIEVRPVERAGAEIDTVWRRCASEAAISVVRDGKWVSWRYLESPTVRYTVLLARRAGDATGYAALRVERADDRTVGFLADLVAPRGDAATRSALIARAVELLRESGAEAAATLAIPGSFEHRTFRRAGFVLSWGSFTVCIVPLDPTLPPEIYRNPQSWRLSGGDFDVV